MLDAAFIFPAVLGYLSGNINISRIITKYVGKFDITTRGSGNAGGTNVARTMGAGWGIVTIILEMIKTLLVCLFCKYVYPTQFLGTLIDEPRLVALYTAAFCLLGNIFPVFYNFKGGKGVSVGAAATLLLDWKIFLIAGAVFLIVFLLGRIVSLGSIFAAVTVPICTALFYIEYEDFPLIMDFAVLIAAVVILRHHSNIRRLLNGTESSFHTGKHHRNHQHHHHHHSEDDE